MGFSSKPNVNGLAMEPSFPFLLDGLRIPKTFAAIRAIGIGDRASGQKFCDYTQFPSNWLYVDPQAELHNKLGLYRGLSLKIPGFSSGANAWLNLMLMCAGMGSPGTLREVFRGYRGDRFCCFICQDDFSQHPFVDSGDRRLTCGLLL